MAAHGGKRSFKLPDIKTINDEISKTEKLGARIIAWCEPDYPEALSVIEDAPPLISIRGQISVLRKRGIGIVGARNASLNGRKMAEVLAKDLGREGITIVSGLARGIDTAAHQGSLTTGTAAVVAGGVDIVYPAENQKLYEQICDMGCVVSDHTVGGRANVQAFPAS